MNVLHFLWVAADSLTSPARSCHAGLVHAFLLVFLMYWHCRLRLLMRHISAQLISLERCRWTCPVTNPSKHQPQQSTSSLSSWKLPKLIGSTSTCVSSTYFKNQIQGLEHTACTCSPTPCFSWSTEKKLCSVLGAWRDAQAKWVSGNWGGCAFGP